MKKLLLILLCLPMIFTSCQKEEEKSSSVCGNVTMTINGVSRGYSPPNLPCNNSQVQTISGQLNLISLSFSSICNNNISDYTITVSTTSTNGLDTGILWDNSCSMTGTSAASYLGGTSPNGIVNISNIDYSNLEISGNFSLYGAGKPTIDCTFSNVPFTLMAL